MRFSRILIAAALSLVSSLPVIAAPIAYASNEGSGTVSMIDTATEKVTATFSVGGKQFVAVAAGPNILCFGL
jgi:YVTN family beta-propeller protein